MSKEQRLRNRKILLGLGAVAGIYSLLPGFYAGGIEDNVRQILTEQSFKDGFGYKLVSYERGWFKSTAKIGLITPMELKREVKAAKWLMGCTEDDEVTLCLDLEIDHGPVITQGDLRLAQAQFRSNWALPLVMKEIDAPQALIEGVLNPFRLNMSAVINFDDSLDYRVTTTPLDFSINESGQDITVDVAALALEGTLAANKTDLTYKFAWSRGDISVDSGREKGSVKFEGLKSQGDLDFTHFKNPKARSLSVAAKMLKANIDDGDVQVDLKNLDASIDGNVVSDEATPFKAKAVIDFFEMHEKSDRAHVKLTKLNASADGTMASRRMAGPLTSHATIESFDINVDDHKEARVSGKNLSATANVDYANNRPSPRDVSVSIDDLSVESPAENVSIVLDDLKADLKGDLSSTDLSPGTASFSMKSLTMNDANDQVELSVSGLNALIEGQMIGFNMAYGNSSLTLDQFSMKAGDEDVTVQLTNLASNGVSARDGDMLTSNATLGFDNFSVETPEMPAQLLTNMQFSTEMVISDVDANAYEALLKEAAKNRYKMDDPMVLVKADMRDSLDAMVQSGGRFEIPSLNATFNDGSLQFNQVTTVSPDQSRTMRDADDLYKLAEMDGQLIVDQSLVKAFIAAFAHSETRTNGVVVENTEAAAEMVNKAYQRLLDETHLTVEGDKLVGILKARDGKLTINNQELDPKKRQ